jgi:hypothetical protein
MTSESILQPVFVMALLNTVMLVWMYATRIPAMAKAGISPESATKDTMSRLPPEVVRVADNYNHLFEQPTLFYAVVLAIAVLGHVDAVAVGCAWLYTGLRIVHSLVQATVNHIPTRFSVFSLSWLVLAILIVRESVRLFA